METFAGSPWEQSLKQKKQNNVIMYKIDFSKTSLDLTLHLLYTETEITVYYTKTLTDDTL